MSYDDRMSSDVATSPIPSPATLGDDSPYEFLTDSLNESMFASPMGDGGMNSLDQLANSLGVASPGVAKAPFDIEVGRGRAYGNQIVRYIPYMRFNEVWAGHRVADLLDNLNMMFEDVLQQAGQGLLPLDLGRVIIVHPDLDNPIVITMRVWHEITPDLFRQTIQNVLNSNQTLTLKTDFQIIVGVVQLPRGKGRLPFLSDDSYDKKRSIVVIKKCMVRAVAVGYAYALREPESMQVILDKYKGKLTNLEIALKDSLITRLTRQKLTQTIRKEQDTLTSLILEKAGLKNVTCFDIQTHIPILEKTLDIQIFFLDHMYKNEFIYKGEPRGTQIYLHLRQNHFDVITSLIGFFTRPYFCTMCFTSYHHRQKHYCKDHCFVCKKA